MHEKCRRYIEGDGFIYKAQAQLNATEHSRVSYNLPSLSSFSAAPRSTHRFWMDVSPFNPTRDCTALDIGRLETICLPSHIVIRATLFFVNTIFPHDTAACNRDRATRVEVKSERHSSGRCDKTRGMTFSLHCYR